jgi:hypothetical protein
MRFEKIQRKVSFSTAGVDATAQPGTPTAD